MSFASVELAVFRIKEPNPQENTDAFRIKRNDDTPEVVPGRKKQNCPEVSQRSSDSV